MFTSTTTISHSSDRLDPAFYSPSAIAAETWLSTNYPDSCQPLPAMGEIFTSAFYEGLAERYSDDGVPFIRVADVQSGIVESERITYLPHSVATSTDGLVTVSGPVLVITKGGSVGNVGVFPNEALVSLSRDVVGIHPHDESQLPVMLFFMASRVGRALLLRGASRQVQAHLTVARLNDFLIPELSASEKSKLQDSYGALLNARQVYSSARSRLDSLITGSDPFVEISKRHLSYVHAGVSELRARMDPEFNRPSHREAQQAAVEEGWIRISDIGRVSWPDLVWQRLQASPGAIARYLPLNSVERGSGRITRSQQLRVWQVPSRGKWVCKRSLVLAPSLVESLDRVALIDDGEAASIASSGFHAIEVSDVSLAAYVVAYLLSRGAHEQILRTGSGVRYRSYSAKHLENLLLPPLAHAEKIADSYWRLRRAAAQLDSAWHAGIATIEKLLDIPPEVQEAVSIEAEEEEDELSVQ